MFLLKSQDTWTSKLKSYKAWDEFSNPERLFDNSALRSVNVVEELQTPLAPYASRV